MKAQLQNLFPRQLFNSKGSQFLSLLTKGLVLIVASIGLTGCLTEKRVQGYAIDDDAVLQVRPGVSEVVVTSVLGTPQTRSTFGDETIYYYVETLVEETAFQASFIKERTVLAVHIGKDKRVARKQTYTLQDGRIIDPVTRRTPSYGVDRTFVTQLLNSAANF